MSAINFPESIVRSVFGEVGYTDSGFWQKELESMFNSLGESDETTLEEFQENLEVQELELFLVLPNGNAIYLDSSKDQFNIFSHYGETYFQCEEIDWTNDLSRLVPAEYKEMVKDHLYKMISPVLKNEDTDFIVKSLTDDNDLDWVLENHDYYRIGLWGMLEDHARRLSQKLRTIEA